MPTANCTRNCWIAGAGLGLLVWILTAGIGPLRWFEGLFLGLVAAGLFGLFLIWMLCQGVRAMDSSEWQPKTRAKGGAEPVAKPAGGAGFMAAVPVAAATPAPAVAPSGDAQPPAGAARNVSARNDIYGAAAKPAPASPSGPAKTGAAKSAADKPVSTKPAPAAKPKTASKKPAAVQTDDLKEIKGIGPKLEQLLHDNGVTAFAQVAAWDDAEIDRFADLIGRMGGRIRTEDWVGQARILAQGGETEFSKRVEKGDVY